MGCKHETKPPELRINLLGESVTMQNSEHAHRRLNLLSGEWVLVSEHRSKRPWQGQVEELETEKKIPYDENCYLCPGNERVSGQLNPDYQAVYSFENDHPAMTAIEDSFDHSIGGLLKAKSEHGCCKVICFSPRHDLSLAELDVRDVEKVVLHWQNESRDFAMDKAINHIQIFENKGAVMGCSNPHPHGQIWAQESIPTESRLEIEQMKKYAKENNGRPLLIDYVELELKEQQRVVCENDDFVVVVPFWASWPFETLVLPKQQCSSLTELSSVQCYNFAAIIKQITIKYDNLFKTSFPYSSGIHQAPCNGEEYSEFTLHMHFYPPLLRSATIKKFMVGYEMLAEAQRDITAEQSAAMLQRCADVHY